MHSFYFWLENSLGPKQKRCNKMYKHDRAALPCKRAFQNHNEDHTDRNQNQILKKNSEYGNQIRWLYLHDSIWLPYSYFFLEFVLELFEYPYDMIWYDMKYPYDMIWNIYESVCIDICISLIKYIYIAIFCHGTLLKKKHLATWGLEPASLVSVNRHTMLYTTMHPQKMMMHQVQN